MRTKVYTNYKWYKENPSTPRFLTVQVNPSGEIELISALQNNQYTLLPLTNIHNTLGKDFVAELQSYGVVIT